MVLKYEIPRIRGKECNAREVVQNEIVRIGLLTRLETIGLSPLVYFEPCNNMAGLFLWRSCGRPFPAICACQILLEFSTAIKALFHFVEWRPSWIDIVDFDIPIPPWTISMVQTVNVCSLPDRPVFSVKRTLRT